MQLFLVTRSEQYYPSPGAQDWQLLTFDEDEARRHFENLDASEASVYLIEIETYEDETCVSQGDPVHRVVDTR